MRLGLLTIIMTCILSLLNGQEPFSKFYHLDSHQLVGHGIIEVDNEFVIFGDGLRKGLDPREDEAFAFRVNAEGDVQWGGFYQDDNSYISFTNQSQSLAHIDGSVYGCVLESSGMPDWMVRNFGYIMRYDIDLDTVFNFHIIDDTATDFNSTIPTGIIQTPFNTLLVCNTQYNGSETRLDEVLIQEITAGDDSVLLNEFRLADPEFELFTYGLLNIEGGYLMYGLSKPIDDGTRRNFYMITLDYNLELQAYKVFDNLRYNAIKLQMIKDADDNYVLFSNEAIFDPTAPMFRQFSSRPLVTKFNPELEIIWQQPATHHDFRQGEGDIHGGVVASHDGEHYFLLGQSRLDDMENGFISKYSKDGDSLWYRVIQPLETEANIDFTVAIQTSDGYYMALAPAFPIPVVEERFHQTFLYKFDEEGHVVNVDRTSVIEEDLLPEISIFPNPTTEILYIEHDEARDITYRLYDNQGKQLMHKTDTQSYHTYILDVGSYSPGTYWLEILDADGSRRVKAVQVY